MRSVYLFYYFLFFVLARIVYPFRCHGKQNIPDGPVIICANHSYIFDPVLIAYAFGSKHQIFFMAKAELFKVPILSSLLKSLGVFPVQRGASDISSIRTAIRHLKDGEMIMLFPEGTRVDEGSRVEAKKGAVRIATKLDVPILPIYLTRGKKAFRVTDIVIGEPYKLVPPENKDYSKLSDELMEKIYALEPLS